MEDNESLHQILVKFIEAKNKDEIFERVFIQFEPLLIKYALKLGDIDMKYFLAESLYEALLKIPLSFERFKEDKYILSYIKSSVFHEFLKISKERSSGELASLDDDIYSNTVFCNNEEFSEFWQTIQLKEIKNLLTEREYKIFWLLYIGYSETEIAKINAVTRQAICKSVKKIRNKIVTNIDLTQL